MKRPALAWFAKQLIGIDDKAINVVNRFRRAVDGKAVGEPWCAGFVYHLATEIDQLFVEMGLPSSAKHQLAHTESTQTLWALAKTVSTTPQVGALALWRSKADKTRGHVGVVIAVSPEGIMTVEGNTSEPGKTSNESNGRGVWRKTRFKSEIPGFELLGYILPWP